MINSAQIDIDNAKRRIHNLVEDYLRICARGRRNSFNKERVKVAFIEPLLEALGWNDQASDIGIIEFGSDLILTCRRNKISVRIHGLNENLEGLSTHGRSLVEQAFQRAFDIRADWLVLTNFEETRLYDCHERKPAFVAMMGSQPLWKIKFSEYESKFDDLWLISKDRVVSGALNAYTQKEEVQYIPMSRDVHLPLDRDENAPTCRDEYIPICKVKHEWIDVYGTLHADGHAVKYFRCTRCGLILKKQYETHPH